MQARSWLRKISESHKNAQNALTQRSYSLHIHIQRVPFLAGGTVQRTTRDGIVGVSITNARDIETSLIAQS